MLDVGLIFSVFLAAFAALLLHDYVRGRQLRQIDTSLLKVSKQLDEMIAVQCEIRQFLVATKSASTTTSAAAEDISNQLRFLLGQLVENDKLRERIAYPD